MAFTAGSPELAKAQKLGSQLAHLFVIFGATGISGATGALMIEQYAEKLGFGITGITTGAGFPPFGSFTPDLNSGLAAVLQNPRGETMPNGITRGIISGRTVGIYMKNFVRSGEDFTSFTNRGVTLNAAMAPGLTGVTAWGPFTVFRQDRLVFNNHVFTVAQNNSAAVGATGFIQLLGAPGVAYGAGSPFDVQVIGVTSGTSGIAGRTFESFVGMGGNFGYTASVYFGTDGLTYWVN